MSNETPLSSWAKIFNTRTFGVVYLLRVSDPNWRHYLERFLQSYLRHSPGLSHELIILSKGGRLTNDNLDDIKYHIKADFQIIEEPNDAIFDIGAYKNLLPQVSQSHLLFLNSSSEILADQWLRILADKAFIPGVGLVGAFGSYESLARGPSDDYFPPFPNPHIRTTGFLINRRLLQEIMRNLKIGSKADCHMFESGRQSLTVSVLARGMRAITVDRWGNAYSISNWKRGNLFRQGLQEGLLFSDNQVSSYALADEAERSRLSRLAWGNVGVQ